MELTKQKDNIPGSFSKVLQTPAKGRVLRATWTLDTFCAKLWWCILLVLVASLCLSFWCRASSCLLFVSTEVRQNLIQSVVFVTAVVLKSVPSSDTFFLQLCCQYFLVTNLLCFLPFYGAIYKLCIFHCIVFASGRISLELSALCNWATDGHGHVIRGGVQTETLASFCPLWLSLII